MTTNVYCFGCASPLVPFHNVGPCVRAMLAARAAGEAVAAAERQPQTYLEAVAAGLRPGSGT